MPNLSNFEAEKNVLMDVYQLRIDEATDLLNEGLISRDHFLSKLKGAQLLFESRLERLQNRYGVDDQ